MAIEKNTLRLRNVGASTLFFTDRPVRIAGHYHTKGEFLKLWSEGPDSFAKNPPNATLSFIEPERPQLLDVVINIRNPRMQGADLLYDFTVIEGTMPRKAGAAVLFIDILGFWRRNLVRAAIVGNAAYRGAYAGEPAAQQRPLRRHPPPHRRRPMRRRRRCRRRGRTPSTPRPRRRPSSSSSSRWSATG